MCILIKSICAGAALCTSSRVTNANAELISAKISPSLSLSLSLSLSFSLSVLLNSIGLIGITSAINRAAKRSDAKERQEEEYFSNLDSSEVRSEVTGQWPMITSGVVFAGRPRHFARRFVKRFEFLRRVRNRDNRSRSTGADRARNVSTAIPDDAFPRFFDCLHADFARRRGANNQKGTSAVFASANLLPERRGARRRSR